jgi:hypothetical protein
MARQLAVIILLSFLFTACTPGMGLAPTADQAEQASPTDRVRPSHTPEDTATPTATFPPVDLQTLLPKVTPTPAHTPSPAPTRTATLDPTYALAPKLSVKVDCNEQYRSYSPDLEWVALVCLTNRAYAITKVYSLDGQHLWSVWPAPDEINARPVEYTYLKPFHWIVTGGYLYLVGYTCCHEAQAKWYSGYSLERLDLVTGKVEIMDKGRPGFNAFHFGFSAGEGFLMTYDMTQNTRLHFVKLVDGVEQSMHIPLAARFVGNEVWAPDGTEMALEGCTSSDMVKIICDTYSIYLVNFDEPRIGVPRVDVLVQDTSTLAQANGASEPVEISKIEWEDAYHVRLYDSASDQSWLVSTVMVWPTPTEEVWKPTEVTPTP